MISKASTQPSTPFEFLRLISVIPSKRKLHTCLAQFICLGLSIAGKCFGERGVELVVHKKVFWIYRMKALLNFLAFSSEFVFVSMTVFFKDTMEAPLKLLTAAFYSSMERFSKAPKPMSLTTVFCSRESFASNFATLLGMHFVLFDFYEIFGEDRRLRFLSCLLSLLTLSSQLFLASGLPQPSSLPLPASPPPPLHSEFRRTSLTSHRRAVSPPPLPLAIAQSLSTFSVQERVEAS
ncbi:hypothetical protein PIB30_069926 [Stylosanthes scabra]|uniref:Uncharacterized protein n=1 Tax=Stylosanthes scabra TaxID=79078 RepID=A0ABU6SNW5_9FABA|nr:hypothetical protein [Stylosanthes scabra]